VGISGLSKASSLSAWLTWQEQSHPKEIDLGLERVANVFAALDCYQQKRPFTITVAGTNGKGSSVALLESILLSAGYSVGSYSTPHLLNYNERIKVNGLSVSDFLIASSFARIDEVRATTSLSYFEFGTLAALDVFDQQHVDVQILEVGLGGRLDAVNIIDADAVLITTIGIDHTAWLGTDISQIALEKAGVFRADQQAVCSDATVPESLLDYAKELDVNLLCAGRDFNSALSKEKWQLEGNCKFSGEYSLPLACGEHQVRNAAGVISLLGLLSDTLKITLADIESGLTTVQVSGRHQVIEGKPPIILDVAHNAQSAQAFADFISTQQYTGSIHAVFSILADKELEHVLLPFLNKVNSWAVAPIDVSRAEDISVIKKALAGCQQVKEFSSVEEAFLDTKRTAQENDLIICFGSFYLVEECLRTL